MRVKGGTVRHNRHKKILLSVRGFRMTIRKRIRMAKQATLHAGEYAFHGRKLRKADFRVLWTQRINAALKNFDLNYSTFISNLKKANVTLNRKMLADLALNEPEVFAEVIKKTK